MTARLAKAEGRFSETAIDDEVVVMSLATGEFFSLAGTARAVWQLIDGTRELDVLVAELATQFGIGPDAIATDVAEFVSELRRAGLITDA